jgi:hypothetical protein
LEVWRLESGAAFAGTHRKNDRFEVHFGAMKAV